MNETIRLVLLAMAVLMAIACLLLGLSESNIIKSETLKHKLVIAGIIIALPVIFMVFVLGSAGIVQTRQQEEQQIENRQHTVSPHAKKEVINEKNN